MNKAQCAVTKWEATVQKNIYLTWVSVAVFKVKNEVRLQNGTSSETFFQLFTGKFRHECEIKMEQLKSWRPERKLSIS